VEYWLVSIAKQSQECTVNSLNMVIAGSNPAGSNPARAMDVHLRVSVLLSCVSVEASHWTHPPTKEPYQMSVDREVH
jgi:hypothetical protein